MSGRRALAAVLAVAACAGVPYTVAHADLNGPDDSIAAAGGPLQPGAAYDGSFVRADDVDHLAFDAQAGQTLHFDVQNTTKPCRSADDTGCPIYATLLDGDARQLGGEGSGAGTGAVYPGDTEGIDWTFAAAGRYYLVMDSAGDLPDYRVRFSAAPGATPPATPPGPPAPPAPAAVPAPPLVKVLGVGRLGAAGVVTARVRLARPLSSLAATLVPRGRTAPVAGRTTLRAVGKGTVVVRVKTGQATRARVRRGTLRLALRLVARPAAAGAAPVTLVRRVPAA